MIGAAHDRRRSAAWIAGLVLTVGCGGDSPETESRDIPFRNVSQEIGWVGMDACRECHFEKHSTYRHTGMGRAFYPMEPSVAVEDFRGANDVGVVDSVMRYRMTERNGRYYQREYVPDSAGNELVSNEHELLWVIGSNNHSRSYAIEIEGKMFQAPICWYPQEEKWELCPGFEFGSEHFSREITEGCIQCHNGRMELHEGERNQFVKPYPHGIGCERCHGPGALHVERWSSGNDTPGGGMDDTIVNPRRLPATERIEICFQCHLGDAKATERVLRHDRSSSSYRPGELLTEVTVPFRYKEPTEWDFGLSAQGDRLLLSRCYLESEGELDCLTCHNPHVTVYHEERPPDFYRKKCLTCHDVGACSGPEPARAATAPADDCIQCHMRRAEPDDQRFTEFTDHWIRRDIDLRERDHRESYDIEPVFADRFARFSRGEQAYYRARARSLLARDAPESRRREMWEEAERDFLAAIDAGYDDVNAWFFLGKTRTNLGRGRDAAEAYFRAHEKDPAHRDAAYAAGQQRLAAGDGAKALAIFRGILSDRPRDAPALGEAGRALMALGRRDEALRQLEQALEIEPWSASLRLNAARVLATLGRMDEAAHHGKLAASLDPDDPGVWVFYENVMKAAGWPELAAEGQRIRARLERLSASVDR